MSMKGAGKNEGTTDLPALELMGKPNGSMIDKFLHYYPVSLTEKEVAVLRCLIDGDTDKQIAGKIGLSVSVVRTHLMKSLFRKLRVRNRTQVAVWAWLNGFSNHGQPPRQGEQDAGHGAG